MLDVNGSGNNWQNQQIGSTHLNASTIYENHWHAAYDSKHDYQPDIQATMHDTSYATLQATKASKVDYEQKSAMHEQSLYTSGPTSGMQSILHATPRTDQAITANYGENSDIRVQQDSDKLSRQHLNQTSNGLFTILQLILDDPFLLIHKSNAVQEEEMAENVYRVMEAFFGSPDSDAYKAQLARDKKNNVTQFAHYFELPRVDSKIDVTDLVEPKSHDQVSSRISEIEYELKEMKLKQSQLEAELGVLSKTTIKS